MRNPIRPFSASRHLAPRRRQHILVALVGAGLLIEVVIPLNATPYFHDAAAARATKIQEVFGEIELGREGTVVRDTLEVLRREQQTALDENFAKQRDQRLIEILSPASDLSQQERLYRPVNHRLTELLPPSSPANPQAGALAATLRSKANLETIRKPLGSIDDGEVKLARHRHTIAGRFAVAFPVYDGLAIEHVISTDKEGIWAPRKRR